LGRAPQEQRLVTGLRNDNWFAALDDSSGDSLSQLIARTATFGRKTARGLNVDLPRVRAKQRHGAADKPMVILEYFEDTVQGSLLVERARQRLTDLDKRRQFSYLTSLIRFCSHPCSPLNVDPTVLSPAGQQPTLL
jgi:hypothetical protein